MEFKPGMEFVGNVNGARLRVIDIEQKALLTESGRSRTKSPRVLLENTRTGERFYYGLEALRRCDITVVGKARRS